MTTYLAGKWNCICDRCGFKFKSDELKRDWQGLMVCAKDFELRHPQDLIKIRPERNIPPWVRPVPVDIFLSYEAFFDRVRVEVGEGSGENTQNYVEEGYLAEDYILPAFYLLVGFSRTFSDTAEAADALLLDSVKALGDTVTTLDTLTSTSVSFVSLSDTALLTDSGFTSIQNYVESTYLAEDYVLDIVSF